jgi:hypothetical protein
MRYQLKTFSFSLPEAEKECSQKDYGGIVIIWRFDTDS